MRQYIGVAVHTLKPGGIAFWGDASREASPQKMRGVTPKNARRHPNACEESPRKWRDGPSPVFRK